MLLPSALGFSPHPPVSVYGTGRYHTIAAFLDRSSGHFTTFFRSASHSSILPRGFSLASRHACPGLLSRAVPITCVPTVLMISGAGISTCCPSPTPLRPQLRSRLPQGRSALPWNPWIFGLEDSHLHLATHSGILSSQRSAALFSTVSTPL